MKRTANRGTFRDLIEPSGLPQNPFPGWAVNRPEPAQMASGTILIAPQGHSETHRPHPLQ